MTSSGAQLSTGQGERKSAYVEIRRSKPAIPVSTRIRLTLAAFRLPYPIVASRLWWKRCSPMRGFEIDV